MANQKLTSEEIASFNKLYAKDLPIISEFLYQTKKRTDAYRLYFNDGTQIVADYNACGDSDNGLEMNDPDYEEFYEFYFIVKKIEKQGSELEYKENEGIALNYHNFFIKFELFEGKI